MSVSVACFVGKRSKEDEEHEDFNRGSAAVVKKCGRGYSLAAGRHAPREPAVLPRNRAEQTMKALSQQQVERILIQELRSETCRCGAEKERGHTFCRNCYYRLQPGLRKLLYRRLGEGYEQAYETAIQVLGFAKPEVDAAPRSRDALV